MKRQLARIVLPLFIYTPIIVCAPTFVLADSDSILSDTKLVTPPQTTLDASPKKTSPYIIKDFSFNDLNGKQHTFKEYRGKWVIVNYWATYCPPCRVEVTDLNIFAEEHHKTAVVLGMDAGGDPVEALKKFKKEFELSYTMAPAQRSTLLAFGVIEALPTTFIVSPKGELVDIHVGMITYDDLAFYTQPRKK